MGLVAVTGAPGSGKSTLARPLAESLGFSLIEKDVIKEALGDALRMVDRDGQHQLSAASFLILDALVPRLRDTVIEGNVYPGSPLAERLRSLPGAVEVFCRCPLETCQERFVGRADRHVVHAGGTPPLDYLQQFAEPLGLDHLVEVATDGAVDVTEVAGRVRAALTT